MGIETMVIGVLVALEVIVTVTAIDAATTGTATAFIAPITILIALPFQSLPTHLDRAIKLHYVLRHI